MKTEYKNRAEKIITAVDNALYKNNGLLNGSEDIKLLLSGIISAVLYLAEIIKEKK